MVVIALARLRAFWEEYPDAETSLRGWYTATEAAEWSSFNDVRATFGNASPVGNCVVFNIGGNKYRLVTRVIYPVRTVYVLKIMTHGEYDDQDKWQSDCGCHKAAAEQAAAGQEATEEVSGPLWVAQKPSDARERLMSVTVTLPDTYYKLVRRFPLVCIASDDALHAALAVVDRLLTEERDAGSEAYLAALSALIHDYEREHHAITRSTPAEVLRELVEANNMTISAVAQGTGIAVSTVSYLMKGVRRPTPEQCGKLATLFGVKPAAFLAAPEGAVAPQGAQKAPRRPRATGKKAAARR